MRHETTTEQREASLGPTRRGGLVVAALLIATAGLGMASTATSADAAPKKKPAVVVSKISGLPKVTTGGAGFKATTTVRNVSKKSASTSIVFRLSRDKKLDGKDKRLTSAKTGKLRPKAAKRVKATVKLPKVLEERYYYVFACVGSSCKVAKTFVRKSASPPPSADDQGKLSGTLTLARRTLDTWSAVDDLTTVNVAMNYKGPFEVSNDLVSTGSTASYSLNHSKTGSSSQGCPTTTTEVAKADRPLVVRGDLYTDEISGDIVDTGFNEIDVDLNIEYVYSTEIVTSASPTNPSCAPSVTQGTRKMSEIVDVRLAKVSRSGQDITYRVKSVTGSYSGSSSWTDVTGTLTLRLG